MNGFSEEIDAIMGMDVTDALVVLLGDEYGIPEIVARPIANSIIDIAEVIFEVELEGKTVEQIAGDLFDIDFR